MKFILMLFLIIWLVACSRTEKPEVKIIDNIIIKKLKVMLIIFLEITSWIDIYSHLIMQKG